jgi:hypothetical protein
MVNAAERIGRADATFWKSKGSNLADRLRAELGAASAPQPSVRARKK